MYTKYYVPVSWLLCGNPGLPFDFMHKTKFNVMIVACIVTHTIKFLTFYPVFLVGPIRQMQIKWMNPTDELMMRPSSYHNEVLSKARTLTEELGASKATKKTVTFKADLEVVHLCVPLRREISCDEKKSLYFTNADFQLFKQRGKMVCLEARCSPLSALLEADYQTPQQALDRWSRHSLRGLEGWINFSHQRQRYILREALIKSLFQAQSQMIQSGTSPDEIAERLADLSTKASLAPRLFAYRLAIADKNALLDHGQRQQFEMRRRAYSFNNAITNP